MAAWGAKTRGLGGAHKSGRARGARCWAPPRAGSRCNGRFTQRAQGRRRLGKEFCGGGPQSVRAQRRRRAEHRCTRAPRRPPPKQRRRGSCRVGKGATGAGAKLVFAGAFSSGRVGCHPAFLKVPCRPGGQAGAGAAGHQEAGSAAARAWRGEIHREHWSKQGVCALAVCDAAWGGGWLCAQRRPRIWRNSCKCRLRAVAQFGARARKCAGARARWQRRVRCQRAGWGS